MGYFLIFRLITRILVGKYVLKFNSIAKSRIFQFFESLEDYVRVEPCIFESIDFIKLKIKSIF